MALTRRMETESKLDLGWDGRGMIVSTLEKPAEGEEKSRHYGMRCLDEVREVIL